MVCIYCGNSTRVTNSRPQKRQNAIWRRRNCEACGALFTTTEQVDLASSLRIAIGKTLTPFDRDTLFISIYEACRHRHTALTDASALCSTIVNEIVRNNKAKDGLVDRKVVIAAALSVLKRFDATAATVYSAYRS